MNHEEWQAVRAARVVTPERARIAAQRLINSHFHNPDHARMTIPVNIDDDDVVIMDYISQTESRGTPESESK